MPIVQVDRGFRYSRSGMVGIQIVVETNDCRPAILFQNGWTLNLSIKPPYIAGRQVRMESNQARLDMHRILPLWQELIPTLMVGARSFAGCSVGGECGCGVE